MNTTKERRACAEYERWASEVKRLTAEIAGTFCPRETAIEELEVESCFKGARLTVQDDGYGQPERPNLSDIARMVADCPECSRLCVLIHDRKHARQRLGVAKRLVRCAGRAALTSEPEEPKP